MVSEIKSTFYKINVHSALTPDQIWSFLKPAIDQANSLKEAYEGGAGECVCLHLPFVIVSVVLLGGKREIHIGLHILCPGVS